jgi:sulfate transport system substrate-binding protein
MTNPGKRAFLVRSLAVAASAAAAPLIGAPAYAQRKPVELLNVSYDPTRELYAQYNLLFAQYWKDKTGQDVSIRQSHGGSGAQARSVIDGLEADVVTLGLAPDIDALVKNGGLVRADWQQQFPNNSAPYTSTIVLLTRKGNPRQVKDWGDLVKPGVGVVTPNPKTSAGARWNYLAAWEYGRRNGGEEGARRYVGQLLKNAPVLDSGARGSTITFAQRGVGDVLLAWENEAFLTFKEFGQDKFELVVPSVSILCEPTVAVVDRNVDRKGTREVAQAYLQYLYSDAAQDVIGKNNYRPIGTQAKAKYAKSFPAIDLVTIGDFGGWGAANAKHFLDGGTFDQLYGERG